MLLSSGVDTDLALYATDTWHIKRLTLTYGLRFEYEKSSIKPSAIGAGRFVGARSFAQIDCTTIKGLGCWKTWSPRIGGVYDHHDYEPEISAALAKWEAHLMAILDT